MIPDGRRMACAIVFAAAFAGYLWTMCPTVYSGDSGDLITASYTLGIAHPTGYPLYMILGKAFSLIPVGSVAYRYNLMSGFLCALAAVFVCLVAQKLAKSWAAAAGAGLMAAFSQAVWATSTIGEAYGLGGFLSAALVWLCIRWGETRKPRDLAWAAAVFGLGLTDHVSSILYLPAFAYLASAGGGKALAKARPLPVLASSLMPLLLYLYLPIRAYMKPAYNWGDPETLERLITHLGGYVHRQVAVATLTWAGFFERFFDILRFYAWQYGLPGVLVVWGLYGRGGGNRRFLNFTALMAAADIGYALFLNDVPLQVHTFCVPSVLVLSVWGGLGLSEAFAWVKARSKDARLQPAIVAAVVLVAFAGNLRVADKSDNLLAYDYAMNMLKTVDPGAVLFAEGDNAVFPLSYVHLVENVRPDVALYERTGILSHELYGIDYFWMGQADHDRRQYDVEYGVVRGGRPVYYNSQPDISFPGYAFQQTGLLFRVAPGNETLPERDFWALYDMRQVWNTTIEADYMSKNIMAAYYIRRAQDLGKADVDGAVALFRQAAVLAPDNANIRYETGTLLLSKKDYAGASEELIAALKLNPLSAKIHNNLGFAFAMKGDTASALKEYRTALQIDPTYVKALMNMGVFLMNEKRYDEAAQAYLRAAEVDPSDGKAYFSLGLAYYKGGKGAEASAAWKRYMELEPDNPNAAQIRDMIAQMESGRQAGSADQ
jgi:tetratricopeptide (TPR) repeat protein